jgi:hypothetical protein
MKPRRRSRSKRVRAIARERVGTVKPSRPIEPKSKVREKPKHKRPPSEAED